MSRSSIPIGLVALALAAAAGQVQAREAHTANVPQAKFTRAEIRPIGGGYAIVSSAAEPASSAAGKARVEALPIGAGLLLDRLLIERFGGVRGSARQ